MAVWPLSDAGLNAMGGALTATSLLTAVSASATPNAVGAWVPLFTSTPWPASGLRVHLGKAGIAVAASNSQTLLNIGVGAAGAEQAVVSDVAIGGALAFATWDMPIAIPMGSRVCVQLRSAVGSKATTMGMSLWGGGMGTEDSARALTYGQTTAASRGLLLTVPGSINTEAAWTVVQASTTLPMRWALIGLAAPDTNIATAADHLVDIGIGAAAAEAAIISDIPCSCTANEEIARPGSLLYPVSVAAGARLVARYRGTQVATAARPNLTVTGFC